MSSYLSHVPLRLLPGLDGVHPLGRHHPGGHGAALRPHHPGRHAHHACSRRVSHEAIGHGHAHHHALVGPHHGGAALSHHGAHDGGGRHGGAHACKGLITRSGLHRKLHLGGAHVHAG